MNVIYEPWLFTPFARTKKYVCGLKNLSYDKTKTEKWAAISYFKGEEGESNLKKLQK